ncbi:MAG: biopolymer transporter ExbD [Thermoguttaceae bacterium]|nr:biopolymer transporter ExbD [Thermoguttaceae bacterium]
MSMRKRKVKVENNASTMQMTSMIDVVFLLLAFFVVTYKTPEIEGDFNIRMPAEAQSTSAPELDELMPVRVRLTSDSSGNLNGIEFGETKISDMKALRAAVYRYVVSNDVSFQDAYNASAVPEFRDDLEIELDCDRNLHYAHTVEAITAVTGYLNAEDQIVKMVDKVKFTPPKRR